MDEYCQNHQQECRDEQPRLVTLSDQPFLASLCSASALQKVEELVVKFLQGPSSNLLTIALRLSHASSVVIGFVGERESLSSDTSRSDYIQGLLALVKALQVLKKKVTLVTKHSATLLNNCLSSDAAKGILKGSVRIIESDNTEMKGCPFQGEINDKVDTIVTLQSEREQVSQDDEKEFCADWVNRLLKRGNFTLLSVPVIPFCFLVVFSNVWYQNLFSVLHRRCNSMLDSGSQSVRLNWNFHQGWSGVDC